MVLPSASDLELRQPVALTSASMARPTTSTSTVATDGALRRGSSAGLDLGVGGADGGEAGVQVPAGAADRHRGDAGGDRVVTCDAADRGPGTTGGGAAPAAGHRASEAVHGHRGEHGAGGRRLGAGRRGGRSGGGGRADEGRGEHADAESDDAPAGGGGHGTRARESHNCLLVGDVELRTLVVSAVRTPTMSQILTGR